MTPDQLDAVWTSIVRAIEPRLDLPELKQFRSIIAELDADRNRHNSPRARPCARKP
jgi:hypothetical protein